VDVGNAYEPAALAEIEAARKRIAGTIVRTPIVRLEIDAPAEIFLKLENLQPIGSFKLRGAGNALALVDPTELAGGVWTASAGNMAQAVAWHARKRGLRCTVVVPETAPRTKLDAIRRLGAEFVKVPVPTWIEVFRTRIYPGMDGVFVHPFSDPDVIGGNGTIGIEIADDLPGVDAVLVPYGGGGLSCGIASTLRALVPRCKVRLLVERARIVAEGAGAASLAAALSGRTGKGKVVCVISGGNIDTGTLEAILAGNTP
jgi:threonine dehydratase